MQIIGVDLHTRQQTVAMLNVETGEIVEKTLRHEGDSVREFYSTLPRITALTTETFLGHAAGSRAALSQSDPHAR
jgi:hypothetical protein